MYEPYKALATFSGKVAPTGVHGSGQVRKRVRVLGQVGVV